MVRRLDGSWPPANGAWPRTRQSEQAPAATTQLGKAGFQAEPIFLGNDQHHVVDVHRGWTTEGAGQVDTTWALVWHFNLDGKVDRVVNLSGNQHQMDTYIWANFTLAPLPDRLT